MKSIREIQTILASELLNNVNSIRSVKLEGKYYNNLLGDTSYLLASLLDMLLKKNKFHDWNSNRWIDDSLLTKIKLNENTLSIWGIMIWGVANETEQWTEPFYFKIELDSHIMNFNKYTFLFSDLDYPEISYENFQKRRDYWDKKYYTDDNWNPSERNWKYIINSKNYRENFK